MRWVVLLLLTGCTAAQANRLCVGGIDTPSEACILVDSAATGSAGAVLGAHALNHDPYDSIRGLFAGDGGADGGGAGDAGSLDAGADGGHP